MAYLTIDEINSDPIYQPPKWWLDMIYTEAEIEEYWNTEQSDFQTSIDEYMTEDKKQELYRSEGKTLKVGDYVYYRQKNFDTNQAVMVKIIKRTKCFITYEVHYYKADWTIDETPEGWKRNIINCAKKYVEEYKKKVHKDGKGNEYIYWDGQYSGSERMYAYKMIDYKKLNLQSKKTAATTLQRAWRKCRYNPEYKMCETVLLNNLRADGVVV